MAVTKLVTTEQRSSAQPTAQSESASARQQPVWGSLSLAFRASLVSAALERSFLATRS